MDKYTFEFDVHEKKLVKDCTSHPTATNKNDSEWLYAVNNKYINESIDPEKVGKWVIFLPKNCVDAKWGKIKEGVTSGELWRSEVSTTDSDKSGDVHTLKVYTKDYEDVDDVINVLEYLKRSRIQPRYVHTKYEKDNPTSTCTDSENSEGSWVYSSNLIKYMGSSIHKHFLFDIDKKEIVIDNKLLPSENLRTDFGELHAKNNKYSEESIDLEKEGMWMLFLPKDSINEAWDKIKKAIANGELWKALVSLVDPERPDKRHSVMIMTKDYSDLSDVIQVLDYLESSGLNLKNEVIKYKADIQSARRMHKGGRERPWMYSSDSIRSVGKDIGDTFEFDIHKNESVSDCILCPTRFLKSLPWLYARNNKYSDEEVDPEKVGKWELFLQTNRVALAWDQIKLGVKNGKLWCAKVSTFKNKYNLHSIMIYTKDFTDVQDVIEKLDYIESSRMKPPHVNIKYITEEESHTGYRGGVYHAGGQKPLYYSETVRFSGSTDNSINDTYEFDIRKKEVVTECDLYPTQMNGNPPWLFAKNNKYPDEIVDTNKVGKWMLFLQEGSVNTAWDEVKLAVKSGELWSAKVSTFTKKDDLIGESYALMIFTKDCADIEDVIQVLDYLEKARIKPPKVNIVYRQDEQSQPGRQKPLYFSNKIRNEFKMDLPWR